MPTWELSKTYGPLPSGDTLCRTSHRTAAEREADESRRRAENIALDRDRILEILHRLVAGVALRLDGYWRFRTLKGTKLFEFIAQYIARWR
jgi:hypothetical protein